MDTPGSSLKTERVKQNKSLKTIEKTLNIQTEYLEAIENDNYHVLPSEFFLKAYLRLYADILGINQSYILSLYADYRQDQDFQLSDIKTRFKIPSLSGLKNLWNRVTTANKILGFFIAVLLAALLAFSITHKKHETPLDMTMTTPVPGISTETYNLSLKVTALSLTWVSVKADDAKPKEWLLRPDETITLPANIKFVIKVGNAGGTRIALNGKDVGVLGPHGKVIDIVLP